MPLRAEEFLLLDQNGPRLRRVDATSAQTLSQIEVNLDPVQLIARDQIYVLDGQSHQLFAYDSKTLEQRQAVSLPTNPVTLVADDEYLWVLHSRSFKLTQIRRQDLTLVGSPQPLGEASPFLLDPGLALGGTHLWVTNPSKGQLLDLDRQTLKPAQILTLGSPTYLMPLAALTDRVYVVLGETLYMLDDKGITLKQVPLREERFSERPVVITQLLVNEERLYAVEPNNRQIFVFERSTLERKPPLKFGRTLGQVSMDNKGRLLVPFPQLGLLSIINRDEVVTRRVGGTPLQAGLVNN